MATKQTARIEYSIEKRGQAYRKCIEVAASKVEAAKEKLVEDQNAYNLIVSYAGLS
jgi:hypothetical protein